MSELLGLDGKHTITGQHQGVEGEKTRSPILYVHTSKMCVHFVMEIL